MKKNALYWQKVKEVNEIYEKYHAKGEQNEFIYLNYIRDVFFISRATFYNYLSEPYKQHVKPEVKPHPKRDETEDKKRLLESYRHIFEAKGEELTTPIKEV